MYHWIHRLFITGPRHEDPQRHRMLRWVGVWRLAGLVLVAATLAGLTAPPASASDLSVLLHCQSGKSQFECIAQADGGVGGYSYDMTVVGRASFRDNWGYWAHGPCNPGTYPRVTVTVRDSAGNVVSASRSFLCRSAPWQ